MTEVAGPSWAVLLPWLLVFALCLGLIRGQGSAAPRERAGSRDRKRIQELERALAAAGEEIGHAWNAADAAADYVQQLQTELADQAAIDAEEIAELEAQRFSNVVPGLDATAREIERLEGQLKDAETGIGRLSATPESTAARKLELSTLKALESDVGRTLARLQGLDSAMDEAADWLRDQTATVEGVGERIEHLVSALEGGAR